MARPRIHPMLVGARLVRVKPGTLSGLGSTRDLRHGVPMPDGTDGSDVYPYDERDTWGANLPAGVGVANLPPPVGGGQAINIPDIAGYMPGPQPWAPSDPRSLLKWSNPTTFSAVPINASTNTQAPVLSLNYQRNSLIIQNNSTATAPDTTAIFYIGFNAQPAVGFGLTLTANTGIVFDTICPRDSVFVLFAGNTGATSVVAGVVIQGTYAPGVFGGQAAGGF